MPVEQLKLLLDEQKKKYEELKSLGLKLDLSRGKPGPEVLDISNGLLDGLDTYKTEDGTDIRNYGVLAGIPELKRLFEDLLGIPAASMIVGGNSSLTYMYNIFSMLYLFGTLGGEPWVKQEKVKILCPCPGYDRHFALTADFGAELVIVPMTDDGPDMDTVERLAGEDPAVKGIWCVPLYSNPGGVVYSDEVTKRLAGMKTAAVDFRVFWDNAYGIHHLWEDHSIADILALSAGAGYPERVYYFFSTSKVTFPGGGVGLVASGPDNVRQITAHLTKQTIGSDKITQLKMYKFFGGSADNIRAHMKKIADILRPKFESVFDRLDNDFAGTGLIEYTKPKGGYFVSVFVPDGCAKRVVGLAKDAGAVLTDAGATFPYGDDPSDSNIRIAPTYPSPGELDKTMELFAVCVKIAALEKYLGDF
ncbi:MAG: aminotransferase [Clostridiales Family XIII bacterium]|jgi:DNA-binding transcriptional MocR family regulator|nr:aminotransferase [Clostridiales Family XIII bacterium]